MTNYAADLASSSQGSTVNARTGTASADAIPAGSYVVWRNTGAGTHVITLTNSYTSDGLTVSNRTISIPAAGTKAGRINPLWGDANGNVAVAIDGTASEVVYYVIGGI